MSCPWSGAPGAYAAKSKWKPRDRSTSVPALSTGKNCQQTFKGSWDSGLCGERSAHAIRAVQALGLRALRREFGQCLICSRSPSQHKGLNSLNLRSACSQKTSVVPILLLRCAFKQKVYSTTCPFSPQPVQRYYDTRVELFHALFAFRCTRKLLRKLVDLCLQHPDQSHFELFPK